MKEMLDIFNEKMEWIGVRSRAEVHQAGHWHQTFQCWFLTKVDGEKHIYFQERHAAKADFPGLLDITAAGHMSAGETREDGVREIEEELGIRAGLDDLTYIGCVKGRFSKEGFIDNEFCHVHFYAGEPARESFQFQDGEVEAVVLLKLEEAKRLLRGEAESIPGVRFRPNESEETVQVTRDDFVPHEASYYEMVFEHAERL
jgi:isopentenyldiphosphate isomerase